MPKAVEASGVTALTIDNRYYSPRYLEGRAYFELPHDAARQLLQHPLWRESNPGPAQQLLGKETTT